MEQKLSLDALNIAYALLRQNEVYGMVSNNLFKGQKPLNFVDECLVVNALPMSKDQLQVCRVNVNIHVPNLTLTLGGKIDKTQPNYPRIYALSKPVDLLFSDYDTDDYEIRIEHDLVIENPDFNSNYNNFRLRFTNINI